MTSARNQTQSRIGAGLDLSLSDGVNFTCGTRGTRSEIQFFTLWLGRVGNHGGIEIDFLT